jgi:hypothetical protein
VTVAQQCPGGMQGTVRVLYKTRILYSSTHHSCHAVTPTAGVWAQKVLINIAIALIFPTPTYRMHTVTHPWAVFKSCTAAVYHGYAMPQSHIRISSFGSPHGVPYVLIFANVS